tara:strand:- start:189 stop:848 length:660 start_codon:yes stop_codon:yes gene_type:complete
MGQVDQQIIETFEESSAKKHGVKLPKKGTQKYEVLKYLFEKSGQIIKKSAAEKEICSRMGTPSKDLQSLRHLGKQNGFHILQGGEEYNGKILLRGSYVFLGFNSVHPFWKLKRRCEKDLDFEDRKRLHDYRCVTCGVKEGEKHRQTNKVVVLQKGHMNPALPMTNDNIIPQCPFCNQVAGNKWIFDPFGFPKYMTEAGLLSHSPEVLKKFAQTLKERGY